MDDDSQEKLIDPNKPKLATAEELIEGLADFDLSGDDHKRYGQSPADSRRAVVEEWQEAHAKDKQRNKEKGHTAQVFDEWDAHRAGEGKADYNAKRKAERQAKAIAEGRPFRPRAPRGQTSPDAKSNAERQAELRAGWTPAQKKAAIDKRTANRKAQRERERAEAAAKLKDGAQF